MNRVNVGQALLAVLSLILVFRLLQLRLHSVYRVFCLFLICEICQTVVYYVEAYVRKPYLDYRVTWVAESVVEWVLSFWTVYALLRALLAHLPGILRFSRHLLTVVTVVCVAISIGTALQELSSGGLVHTSGTIGRVMGMALLVDRIVATTIFLVILSIVTFILWFPVSMPRNLAIFTIGFFMYFTLKTALLLVQSFVERSLSPAVGLVNVFLLSCTVAFWLFGIRAGGERRSVTLAHTWRSEDRDTLFAQLETLNQTLSRASKRDTERSAESSEAEAENVDDSVETGARRK